MPIAVSWRDWQERAGPEPEGQRGKQVPSGQGREMRFLGREEQKWGARQDCGCWHRLLSVCPGVSFKTSQTHHSFYLFIYPQEWTNVINDGFPHPQRARYQAHFGPAPPTVHIYFLPSWAPFFLCHGKTCLSSSPRKVHLYLRLLLLKVWSTTSSICLTWNLVRNAESQATLPHPSQNLQFNKIPSRFMCTFMFAKHYPDQALSLSNTFVQ